MCLFFIVYSVHTLYSEPGHNISYKITCPPSNDSDQPAQMRRLIRVIALRFLSSQTSYLPLDGRQRFCLERVDVQADLSLCCAHKQPFRKLCA